MYVFMKLDTIISFAQLNKSSLKRSCWYLRLFNVYRFFNVAFFSNVTDLQLSSASVETEISLKMYEFDDTQHIRSQKKIFKNFKPFTIWYAFKLILSTPLRHFTVKISHH